MTELIQACESDLRAGRISNAAAKLRTVNSDQIPKEWRLKFANLYRRARMDYQALKLLWPAMQLDAQEPASREEQAEYAASLIKVGATHEALNILADIQDLPSAKLFKAFGHMTRFEHAQAIPLLKTYIEQADSAYSRRVGQINLAAAHVALGAWIDAEQILTEVIKAAEIEGHKQLWANGHELRAQIYIHKNELDLALTNLEKAAHILTESGEALKIRKWYAVIDALKTQTLEPLNHFRSQAEFAQEFEHLRDIDFFSNRIQFDQNSFDHLLMGTPFATYREHVTQIIGRKQRDNTRFVFGNPQGAYMDVSTGEIHGMQIKTSPGNTVHRLIAVLLGDLYRPWSIGSIFAELFSEEKFDASTTPNRIHQLLWRLRRWFETNQIPVEVVENEGQYRLKVHGAFAFVLPEQKIRLDEQEICLRKIHSLFGPNTTFSSREVQAKLGISSSSFKRLASWALEHKRLQRMGASRATVYKVVA